MYDNKYCLCTTHVPCCGILPLGEFHMTCQPKPISKNLVGGCLEVAFKYKVEFVSENNY